MSESTMRQELGVDISLLSTLERAGASFSDVGGRVDPLVLLREAGFKTARLRLFHAPSGQGAQINDLDYTVELASRCVEAGFDILLCPHFSDTWADPSRQHPPQAWRSLNHADLLHEVRSYAASVIDTMQRAGCAPKMVQVGNEITGGFLWDAGCVTRSSAGTNDDWGTVLGSDRDRWEAFASLLRSAIRGIADVAHEMPGIMLHIDRGGDEGSATRFFEWMERCEVRFDHIGLSYYPFWHGSLDQLCRTVAGLNRDFGRPIHVVETAFPAEPHPVYGSNGEQQAQRYGTPPTHAVDYELSESGQHAFVSDLLDAMRIHADRGWRSVCYWAPEWIRVPNYNDEPDAATCWPRALFDSEGRARAAIEAFRAFQEDPVVTVRSTRPGLGVGR